MRPGFTLVELVVVILILGILGAMAASKMFDTSGRACDNTVRRNLATIRDAIDIYLTENKKFPGANGNQATFKSDLAPYIRKFPILPVGSTQAQDDQVVMDASTGPVEGDNNPNEGWRYYFNSGVFIVNSNKKLSSDNSIEYDDL